MTVRYISTYSHQEISIDYAEMPLIEIVAILRTFGVSRASFSTLPSMPISTIDDVQAVQVELAKLTSH